MTDASIPASERAALLRILGAANPAAVAGLLDRLLAPGEDAAIQSAALAAAESAAKAGHGVPSRVRELAMSPDVAPESAAAALRALLAAGGSDAAGAADRMLDSPDPAIRSRAAVALAGATEKSLLPQMHRALRDVPESHAGPLMNAIATAKDKPWSAIQITGEPDTIRGGDLGTAWAAKQPEMGLVTIELGYAEAVLIERIRIHETLCPGGVVEIAWRDGGHDGGHDGVRDGVGDWRPLWSGRADSGSAPRWFEAEPSVSVVAREIRLTIDTAVAQGWEEIDAVELVGGGGRQWASSARASSSYAD
ncbi:MAG: hypothetical protein HMLKMBBP_02037 [Planctomycetes bacterium]|nr:hypothetical protein [Planctomycetota bacterium]